MLQLSIFKFLRGNLRYQLPSGPKRVGDENIVRSVKKLSWRTQRKDYITLHYITLDGWILEIT